MTYNFLLSPYKHPQRPPHRPRPPPHFEADAAVLASRYRGEASHR